MKKVKIFLVLIAIVIGQGLVWGQDGVPIRPYKENGYSKEELKNFLFAETPLSDNFRWQFIILLNRSLKKNGKNLMVNENNLEWIVDSAIVYRPVSLKAGHTNSGRVGNRIHFFKSTEPFQGEVGIFVFDGIFEILFKTICLNLLEVETENIGREFQPPPSNQPVISGNVNLSLSGEIKLITDTILHVHTHVHTHSWENNILPQNESEKKEGSFFKKKILPFVIGAIISGVATYLLLKKKGDPGGAPTLPGEEPGGPGGAPTTPAGGPGGAGGAPTTPAGGPGGA